MVGLPNPDDEDEEGEEGFEEIEEFDDVERPGRNRHRDLDSRKQKEEEVDAEEIAARLKERYGRTDFSRGAFRGDVEHVPQNVLIPSLEDPKLWLLSCRVYKF
jgi:transcription elongation factor SPT5